MITSKKPWKGGLKKRTQENHNILYRTTSKKHWKGGLKKRTQENHNILYRTTSEKPWKEGLKKRTQENHNILYRTTSKKHWKEGLKKRTIENHNNPVLQLLKNIGREVLKRRNNVTQQVQKTIPEITIYNLTHNNLTTCLHKELFRSPFVYSMNDKFIINHFRNRLFFRNNFTIFIN